jgi:hypothetical protein
MTTDRDPNDVPLHKKLQQLFELGKQYWYQADSESYSQNRKSHETHRKAMDLMAEIIQGSSTDTPERKDSDRYVWLLSHEGLVKITEEAIKWDPDRHKPLLVHLQGYIDQELLKTGDRFLEEQRRILREASKA